MDNNIQEICLKIDSCNGDIGLLREAWDYIVNNKSLYQKHEVSYIKEHINNSIKYGNQFIELVNLA